MLALRIALTIVLGFSIISQFIKTLKLTDYDTGTLFWTSYIWSITWRTVCIVALWIL